MPKRLLARRKSQTLKDKSVVNFGKGLNNLVSDNLINDREAAALDNVDFVEAGAVSKRPGITQVGDDLSNNPRGLGVFITESTREILTVDGTALKKLAGSTWTTVSGETFDSSSEIAFTQARGKLYIWDGVNGGADYDGTTLNRPGTMPKAKFAIFYQGFQWCAGVEGQPNRLYMSTATDASDFTDSGDDATSHPGVDPGQSAGTNEANHIDINKEDGDEITGLGIFQDILIVFKQRSIFQITLDSSSLPEVSPITGASGCVSHKSIEQVGNDLFYMSRDGFFVLGNEPNFFTAIRTNELSARIKGTIDSISEANITKVNAIYFDNKYIAGFPVGGSAITNTVTYDRRFLGWSKWSGIKPNSMATFVDSSNEEHLYFAADDDVKVYEIVLNQFNDDGAAITQSWTSKAYDMGDFSQKKRFVFIDLLFRQLAGDVTITVIADGESTVKSTEITTESAGGMGFEMLGEEDLGIGKAGDDTGTTSNVPYRVRVNTNARTLQVKLENDGVDENFVLLGLKIGFYVFSPFLFDSARKLQ